MMSDAKAEGYRRVEILTGPRRRREWSEDDKARAVAESCELHPVFLDTDLSDRRPA